MSSSTRILHVADIHLDRPFVGFPRDVAARRRADLFETLRSCLQAAKDREADLVTIGGDMWEDENVTADTRASVAHELSQLEIPALLIGGNHDPILPGGNYARTEWPPNVHLFDRALPSEWREGDVSVWGASWTGGRLEADFLEHFQAPGDGRAHLLLLHDTSQGGAYANGNGFAHCPFDPALVPSAGFSVCLAGHIHAAMWAEGIVYPGSPEPLGWGELGRHCYAVVDVETPSREVSVDLVDANRRRYEQRTVDCSGAASSAAVGDRIGSALDHDDACDIFLRMELTGQVDPVVSLDAGRLSRDLGSAYADLLVLDRTQPAYDLDMLAGELTARGRYVRRLRERLAGAADEQEREVLTVALQAGLRALDGREDVA